MTPAAANVGRDNVEAFLDDNGDFLEDYVTRKVPRAKLEGWLFRGHPSSGRRDTLGPSTTTTSSGVASSPAAALRRQRSRSFTPLRKLSATRFEEGGLSTPILVKGDDGLPTFLKSQVRAGGGEEPHLPPQRTISVSSKTSTSSTSSGISRVLADRNQSLCHLLEDVLQEPDASGIAACVGDGLAALVGCGHAAVLLVRPDRPLTGDLHVFDGAGGGPVRVIRNHPANRLMTGVMTSRQTLRGRDCPEVAAESGNREVMDILTAPIVGGSCDSSAVVGAIQLALLQEGDARRSFGRDDEALINAVVRFAGIALTAAAEKQEMQLEISRSEVSHFSQCCVTLARLSLYYFSSPQPISLFKIWIKCCRYCTRT